MRPAFATLWNLDLALADVVATTSEPALGAIRLAWWRERLEELDRQGPVGGEPRLSAIARQLVGRGITGKELAQLADAWPALLAPFPWGQEAADGLRRRGRILFAVGAKLLGGAPGEAAAAGEVWSLADGAMHCSDAGSRRFLLGEARAAVSDVPRRLPRELRPLTVLATVAASDALGRTSAAARGAAALTHRLTGRFPR